MKLKFLSLYLALGMFVLGTGVNADTAQAPSESTNKVAKILCGLVRGYAKSVKDNIPECDGCSDFSSLTVCLQAVAQHPSTLSRVCYSGCNTLACKAPLVKTQCMKYCCPANADKIKNCLKQGGGATCP
ncbi:MAG: hypothetical protein BGO67_11200 [Alphaproteobacteria bacterium 41-28]|nr:MAG: hypothetical protein BGO67_11200 [Alphaproteobacteria bacterium 41-28]